MRRKFVLIFLLFLIVTCNMYSESGFSFGVFGAGISSDTVWDNGYMYGRFFSFYYQTDSGFGVTVSPLLYTARMSDISDDSLTFVNVSAYYDFLNEQEQFILGPVVTVHAVEYNQLDFIESRFGLQYTVQFLEDVSFTENPFFDRELFAMELGYKYNKQQQGFYVHLGINVIMAFYYLGHL